MVNLCTILFLPGLGFRGCDAAFHAAHFRRSCCFLAGSGLFGGTTAAAASCSTPGRLEGVLLGGTHGEETVHAFLVAHTAGLLQAFHGVLHAFL